MKKFRILLFVVSLMLVHDAVNAQCSMCRRVAETNLESGEKKGRGLNTGILYLMSVPYLMGGVACYMWWKSNKKKA
ncbi:MAG: hypothetical protein KA347_08470 [Bacteroidia bacterium]|nr:hypothetical protein [Bacteroidia bacterium]MBP7244099.1 hypothetical protein [Bacteroidia bacterium]